RPPWAGRALAGCLGHPAGPVEPAPRGEGTRLRQGKGDRTAPEPFASAPARPYPAAIMSALCRDCLTVFDSGRRCPACRAPRVLAHPELDSLSIAHMDCDAFYASVEQRDDPSLREQPLIVGGGQRGVVSTCCYLARIKGVRSAMPMFQALRLCPEAKVIRPRMRVYAEVSRQIRA